MRALALALLFGISCAGAALAQQDPAFYSDRAYEYRRDHPDAEWRDGQGFVDRGRDYRDDNRDRRDYRDRRESEARAYERGRREAEREQSQRDQNNIIAPLERLFNNR